MLLDIIISCKYDLKHLKLSYILHKRLMYPGSPVDKTVSGVAAGDTQTSQSQVG